MDENPYKAPQDKDRTLTYLLSNCAAWGLAVIMVMGAYGVDRRNETLPLVLQGSFTAAAFLPFLVVPLIRRWRR